MPVVDVPAAPAVVAVVPVVVVGVDEPVVVGVVVVADDVSSAFLQPATHRRKTAKPIVVSSAVLLTVFAPVSKAFGSSWACQMLASRHGSPSSRV